MPGRTDIRIWRHGTAPCAPMTPWWWRKGGRILGFGDMTADGYLDRLFVHREAQGRGIASALCAALECRCSASEFTVHASRTAQPFFQGRGYQVVREQQVERRGVLLTNFLMVRPADGVEEKRK